MFHLNVLNAFVCLRAEIKYYENERQTEAEGMCVVWICVLERGRSNGARRDYPSNDQRYLSLLSSSQPWLLFLMKTYIYLCVAEGQQKVQKGDSNHAVEAQMMITDVTSSETFTWPHEW